MFVLDHVTVLQIGSDLPQHYRYIAVSLQFKNTENKKQVSVAPKLRRKTHFGPQKSKLLPFLLECKNVLLMECLRVHVLCH